MNKPIFQTRIVPLMATLSLLYYSIVMLPLATLAYETDGTFRVSGNLHFLEDPGVDENQEETSSYPDSDRDDEASTEGDHVLGNGNLPDTDLEEDHSIPDEDVEPELEDPVEPEDEVEGEEEAGIVIGSFEPNPAVRLPAPRLSGSRTLPNETPRLPAPRETEPVETEPEPTISETESTPSTTAEQETTTDSSDGEDAVSQLPQTGMERARPWLIGLGLLGISGAAIYFKNKQDSN